MTISEDLLLEYGAIHETHEINHIFFREGSKPNFYYQIVNGIVELNNYREDGKEFTQNIFFDGQSFGESLLFNDKPYPMTAVAKNTCTVLKLTKTNFLEMLKQNPETTFNMFRCLSDRLYYKYLMLFNISSTDPVYKIKTLIEYLKEYNSGHRGNSPFQVPFTRQQLANLTGLRVETVIRTIKKMETLNMLQIKSGKIYY
jgi:CRP-like cAMP-binding protein